MQVSALAGLSGLGDLAPRPQSLWTHETAGVESPARKADSIWAVFKTHEEVSVCVSYLGLGFLLAVVGVVSRPRRRRVCASLLPRIIPATSQFCAVTRNGVRGAVCGGPRG